MIDDQDEPELPPALRDALAEWQAPPPAPREALWARIEAARHGPDVPVIALDSRRPRPWRRAMLAWPAGIAALLAIGIGVGRWTARGAAAPAAVASSAPAPPAGDAAYRLAAQQYFAQAETYLTLFRAAAKAGTVDTIALPTARVLLASNRLLRDSRAADDPHMRALLDDLELVLAQIAALDRSRLRTEMDLITDGLEHRGVLPRIRATVSDDTPAPSATGET